MMKREGDYQKPAVDEDRAAEDTERTYHLRADGSAAEPAAENT